MNSAAPIECLGDVQVMNYIYPPEKARQTTSEREISKVRQYMPFDDYQRVQKCLRKTRRKLKELKFESTETQHFDWAWGSPFKERFFFTKRPHFAAHQLC